MKGLNLKKVAAVGAGLALVAASVSAAVGWSDLVNTSDHTMKVNGIVVGDTAHADDTVAANLLAAKLAEKAVYTVPGEEKTEYQMVKECKTVEGSEFSGASKKYDDKYLGAAQTKTVTYTQLGTDILKYESTLSYKIGGATYDAYAKEQLKFTSTPSFDTSSKVKRLNAESQAGEISYTVTYGSGTSGIDFNKDSGFTSSTWTDSGASDKVEIPFLGKTYVVHKVVLDSSASKINQLELFEKNAIKTFTKGDKITDLKGKDGKTYYAVIEGMTTDLYAVMSLYDAATGQVVEDYKSEKVGTSDKFAEDVLETVLEITDIYNLGTTDVPDYRIEMAVGTQAVTIYDGKGYPYDSTKTSTSDYDWTATIGEDMTGNTVVLQSITLQNTSKYDFKNEDGLAPGGFLKFPGDLAILKFVGLQLPEFNATNPKEVYTYEFGADVEEGFGKGITYIDSSGTKHEVPFYYELSLDDADSGDSLGADYKVDNFVFDGKTYSIKIDYVSDGNMDIYLLDGSYAASATTYLDKLNDANLSTGTKGVVADFHIPNSEDTNVEYAVAVDKDEGTMWLLLDDQDITTKTGTIDIVGTDVNGESTNFPDVNGAYYLPADDGSFETYWNAHTPNEDFDNTYASLFKFYVDEPSTDNIKVVIDTETGTAVAKGASSHASNSIPGPGYQLADANHSTALELKKGETNGLEMFYDDYGTKASIDADYKITLVVPEEQAAVEFQVIGKGGTAKEECTDVNKLVTTKGEDKNVTYTGLPFTPIKASEASATGKYIVVGGYIVNSLFAEAAKDAEETAKVFGTALAAEGDKVTAALNGNVYIAGYTKEDTMDAVKALIATLDQSGP